MVSQPVCHPAGPGGAAGAHAPGLRHRGAPPGGTAARGRPRAGRTVKALCRPPARLNSVGAASPPSALLRSHSRPWAAKKKGDVLGGRSGHRVAPVLPVGLMMHWWNGGHGGVCPLHIKWCHLSQASNGEFVGSCPKMPSDLEAKIGVHIDTKNPDKSEEVFGYLHLKTTDLNLDLGLEVPLGNSTYPGNTKEGTEFIPHRSKLAVPLRPGQMHLGDSANDIIANYEWLHDRGAIAIFAYNRRNEHIDETSLLNRGYDQNGTPYAPCGRLCHSNGYDYEAQSRQYVCGLACPPEEQQRCPHRYGVLGYSHRMRFTDHPRLIGPIQRGSKAWHDLYGARSASERTNSYDQEVVAKAHPLRMRGLKAFHFAGAIRALAQLLRRALNFVLDVTYTQGKTPVAQT